ncbi:unnamed protein product [Chondrus crispus]|uniref:Uncharacterized protein n=1 Tax=Chondrus crispus TaxID=2769 RepID=R7QI36_CHOCR|nr:unnamed protein product [Chondrus crispus]CDF37070.1 unnamed protein product [Chondrus crispus]|eukprot:XP_005716889.1 unnamed protein product [Chondrus crispus]
MLRGRFWDGGGGSLSKTVLYFPISLQYAAEARGALCPLTESRGACVKECTRLWLREAVLRW